MSGVTREPFRTKTKGGARTLTHNQGGHLYGRRYLLPYSSISAHSLRSLPWPSFLPHSLIHNCSTPISNDDFVTPVTIALMGCALSRVAAGVRSFMTEFPSHTDIESEKSQRKEDKIVKFLPVFPLAIIPFLRRDPILRAQACFMGGGGGAALTSWDAGCYQAQ